MAVPVHPVTQRRSEGAPTPQKGECGENIGFWGTPYKNNVLCVLSFLLKLEVRDRDRMIELDETRLGVG